MYTGRNGWLRLLAVAAAIATLTRFGKDFRTGRLLW